MPSASEAIASASNLGDNGYVKSDPPSQPDGSSSTNTNFDPGRNNMIRCPMPPLWSESSDSQRQFYINGQVPQTRFMTPQTTQTNAALGDTSSVVIEGTTSGGGSSSGTVAAAQAVVTTPVLPPGSKFVGSIGISKSFQLLSVAVGSPCRLQFYGTAAAQSQDLGRGLDVPPPAGVAQNIITDVALDTAPYQWSFQARTGANADAPQKSVMYVTITNLDAKSDAVTMTLQYVSLETT